MRKELYSLTLSLYSLTTAMLEFKVTRDPTVTSSRPNTTNGTAVLY
jgi:hypothetical protein